MKRMMTEQKKYKLGVALSGGGAKGFAHCGALLALEEFGLRPDVISGTSAGAIVGALYAAGNDPQAISRMFMGKEFTNFVRFKMPKAGLFDHAPFATFLRENLRVGRFDELRIPLHVVASDLDHGRSVVFTEGDLGKALLASSCVPVVFSPVEIDGVHYVDGGIFRNFPVVPIRDLCEQVIGINVSPLISSDYKQNVMSIAMRSYHFMFRANTFEDKELCDMLVEVEEAHHYSTFDLENIQAIFRLGYDDTVRTLEEQYGLKRVLPPTKIDLPAPHKPHRGWKERIAISPLRNT